MILCRPALLFLFAIPALPLWPDEAQLAPFRTMLDRSAFPENDETRRRLADAVSAPLYPAEESPFRSHRQLSDGRLVQFELRRGLREWYLIFRNQRGEEPRETYPVWGRGTWIIKKDLLSGEYLQAKIFLQDDEESFVRIFPATSGRSRADIHLYGRRLGDDVIIPVSFEELLFSPFARIVLLTDRSWDWSIIFPNPARPGHRRVENLVEELKPYADRIVEIADAAVDGGGRNVYIETGEPIPSGELPPGTTGLNCSGYIKWVADGAYSSWTAAPGSGYMDILPLRAPTARAGRNPWSDSRSAVDEDARSALETLLRDPRFGLDWTRNIAALVEESRLGRRLTEAEKAALDTGPLPGIPHRADIGYPLADLPAALYQLAGARPGALYLAAVNSRFVPAPSRQDPDPLPLHQYWHVSILAPWFDDGSSGERGAFHVAVLDTGDAAETLLRSPGTDRIPQFPAFITESAIRYAKLGLDAEGRPEIPEIMVHLVRMDIPPNFRLSPLPEAY